MQTFNCYDKNAFRCVIPHPVNNTWTQNWSYHVNQWQNDTYVQPELTISSNNISRRKEKIFVLKQYPKSPRTPLYEEEKLLKAISARTSAHFMSMDSRSEISVGMRTGLMFEIFLGFSARRSASVCHVYVVRNGCLNTVWSRAKQGYQRRELRYSIGAIYDGRILFVSCIWVLRYVNLRWRYFDNTQAGRKIRASAIIVSYCLLVCHFVKVQGTYSF